MKTKRPKAETQACGLLDVLWGALIIFGFLSIFMGSALLLYLGMRWGGYWLGLFPVGMIIFCLLISAVNPYRSPLSIKLADGRVSCSHVPEPHISFDPTKGYRARVECRCGKINIALQHTRPTLAEAEADSRVLDALARKAAQ